MFLKYWLHNICGDIIIFCLLMHHGFGFISMLYGSVLSQYNIFFFLSLKQNEEFDLPSLRQPFICCGFQIGLKSDSLDLKVNFPLLAWDLCRQLNYISLPSCSSSLGWYYFYPFQGGESNIRKWKQRRRCLLSLLFITG